LTDGTKNYKKSLEKTQRELLQSIEQCKAISAKRELLNKELSGLKTTAQAIMDMVDLVEEGASTSKTLVEHIHEAPQRIANYLTETSKQYVAHVLVLVKSYCPEARLAPLGDGMSVECNEEKFTKYVEEAKPIGARIVEMLE